MNHDGVKQGFANEALAVLADTLSIPVIASGGAGTMEHFKDVFQEERQMPLWLPLSSISMKSLFPI